MLIISNVEIDHAKNIVLPLLVLQLLDFYFLFFGVVVVVAFYTLSNKMTLFYI